MDSKSKVYFFLDNVSFSLRNRIKLKKAIEQIFKKEGKKLSSLNYIFCTDDALLAINGQYLNHHYYTDIVTFDLSENNKEISGEIYISIDRVKDNASGLPTTFSQELLRVIFHGALHLCGYRDKTKSEITKMRGREDYYLKNY
jgi:rRNA maturation RNase YbeY